MMHGNWYNNGFCPQFGGGSILILHGLMMIGLVVVIFLFAMFVKNRKNINDGPLQLLKIQYVNGTITEEEYLNKKNVLEGK